MALSLISFFFGKSGWQYILKYEATYLVSPVRILMNKNLESLAFRVNQTNFSSP
jgi:hypothetical protein